MKFFSWSCCLAVILFAGSGCSSLKHGTDWNPLNPKSQRENGSDEIEPTAMAVIWKESVYEQPGVPSIKGFGGRFFLYDQQNEPVKASGELIVYGYDESNSTRVSEGYSGADKKFVFPREKFSAHFSDSNLGPSYSVWIPWEEAGGLRKSITLIPVFKTAGGNVVRCGQSMIVLPGRSPKNANANNNGSKISNTQNLVAQASFQQAPANQNGMNQVSSTTNNAANGSNIRTTTLNLPPSLAKKLQTKPAIPSRTTPSDFPRPDAIPETRDARPLPSNTQGETQTPPVTPGQPDTPAPRIFGMPGSF